MLENIRKLYRHYGGFSALIRSQYLWLSIILTGFSVKSAKEFKWADLALGALPSLAGFALAAFAIIFASLDNEARKKLIKVDDNGNSSMASISATISHAVLIQALTIIFSISSKQINIDSIKEISLSISIEFYSQLERFNTYLIAASECASIIGIFLLYYSMMLVIAVALSLFRFQLLLGSSSGKNKNTFSDSSK